MVRSENVDVSVCSLSFSRTTFLPFAGVRERVCKSRPTPFRLQFYVLTSINVCVCMSAKDFGCKLWKLSLSAKWSSVRPRERICPGRTTCIHRNRKHAFFIIFHLKPLLVPSFLGQCNPSLPETMHHVLELSRVRNDHVHSKLLVRIKCWSDLPWQDYPLFAQFLRWLGWVAS